MKYSSDDQINEVVHELIDRYWLPVRGTKHWKLFSPSGDFRFIINGSPSDFRAPTKFISDVKRILKQRGEEPLERHRKPMEKQITVGPAWAKEPARIIVKPAEPKIETKVEQRGHFIPRDPKNQELILKLREEGKGNGDIATILTAMGYAKLAGGQYDSQDVALWFYKIKKETEAPAPKAKEAKAQVTNQPPPLPPIHTFLSEVMEIVSSNLSDEAKERFLVVAAKEWVSKLSSER